MRVLFVAAIAVIAFAAAFTLYFFLNSTSTTATVTITGNEIATKSSNFLTKMKRADGKYDYSMNCTDTGGCVKKGDSYTQTGAWAVLAYAGLYKSTNDPNYLQKMNGEVTDLISSCNGKEDECLWILVQMIKAYNITKNSQYLTFVENLANRLMTNNDEENSSMLTGIESREFALVYELTGDQKYLNEANVRLAKSKVAWNPAIDSFNALIYNSSSFTFYRYACWTELAESEIARASGDNQAKANVINFLKSANFESNYKTMEHLSTLQPCIETLLNAYQQTGDRQYFDQAKFLMQYIITYRWDSPIPVATKYNGDGAFLFEWFTGDNVKTVTDTGYMMYLLSQMPNEQFEILNWR